MSKKMNPSFIIKIFRKNPVEEFMKNDGGRLALLSKFFLFYGLGFLISYNNSLPILF